MSVNPIDIQMKIIIKVSNSKTWNIKSGDKKWRFQSRFNSQYCTNLFWRRICSKPIGNVVNLNEQTENCHNVGVSTKPLVY